MVVESSKTSRQAALLKELEELERRRRELLADLGREGEHHEAAGRRTRSIPVRDAVLNALEDLGCLAFSRELLQYLNARYRREVPSARFGTLAKDEQAAFDSKRPRPVFLAHGLTSERFEPIKRLWGRSDWPLWRRVVAPTTGRVQHLEMTLALCNVALVAVEGESDTQMLKILAADHARDVPGVQVKRGEFPIEAWRDRAQALLDQYAAHDRERREDAARKLERLPLRAQLFGAPETTPFYEVPATGDDRGGA